MNIKFSSAAFLVLLLIVVLSSSPLLRGQHLPRDHPYYRKGLVWEPAVKISPEVEIPGFLRPNSRRGYKWIEGEWDGAGRWHPGYWKPLNEYRRKGGVMKWVGGYWSGERWIPGYWRLPEKAGYVRVEGYYDLSGRWNVAHWEPFTSP